MGNSVFELLANVVILTHKHYWLLPVLLVTFQNIVVISIAEETAQVT